MEPFARRLSSCASPELLPLLELPGVRAPRYLHNAKKSEQIYDGVEVNDVDCTHIATNFPLESGYLCSFVVRAKQLHLAGFTSMEKIGKARPVELSAAVEHLSLKAAMVIIQVLKIFLTIFYADLIHSITDAHLTC